MPHIVHVDIAADDPQRATRFYEAVFDWQIQTLHGATSTSIQLINTGFAETEPISASIAQRGDAWRSITPLIDVDSVDTYAARIVAAGGGIVHAKQLIPGIGYLLIFRDTEGNELGLVEELPETMFAKPGGRA
ncbi:MAG: VOC family protein [Thiobacillus sp.]|uniref:VOC family protein n=1 Tax=Thiobacillus sp. TaxID=924 RepID=UPI002895BFC7|nr:VOC family protein [Thiobacillus sp.]MDT3707419.1 VOC family protein [Thiobacillus sp.]